MSLKTVSHGIVSSTLFSVGWVNLIRITYATLKNMSLNTCILLPPPIHSLTLTGLLISWGKMWGMMIWTKASRVILILTLTRLFPHFVAHSNHLGSFKNNPKSYPVPVKSEGLAVEARQFLKLPTWSQCTAKLGITAC